ncbi:MAG TPA: LysM peptidoglycan-binding domain-containing M23 family metallopeptidase [Pseudolabrys sp.]|nr:LysM peptidoglycan-binding domain-containing M23 family metallopeptidase [Pseudolabrys sp.]
MNTAAQPVAYPATSASAYGPPTRHSDVTGTVTRSQNSTGHWTWNGGSPVTVAYGETIETIARKHGVPASAVMQTNGIREPGQIRPGQRLVIPRYVSNSSKPTPTHAATPSKVAKNVHVVRSGETLMSISRQTGASLTSLARANHIDTSKKLSVGERLVIPDGNHVVAASHPPRSKESKTSESRPQPHQRVASASVATANIAKEEPRTTETAVKAADPSGAMPSFRWPVRGRVIAGFGSKPNGTQNDGINLAVPQGTPIKAADDGVVAYAGNELKGYGNLVLIRHANGYVSAYAHASEILVRRGDTIRRGQVIAHAGQTGNVNSPQLHFEIRKGSTPVDPTQYLGGA